MKNQSRWVRCFVFILVTIFFVLPPIFFSPSASGAQIFSAQSEWEFPVAQIARSLCLAVIFLAFCRPDTENDSTSGCHNRTALWAQILWTAGTFLALCASAAFFEFVGRLLDLPSATAQIARPKNVRGLFFCGATFLAAAAYEEILYRFYLPATMEKDFFLPPLLAAAAAVFLFALAHMYLGALAVINAAVSGLALIVCAQKTRSVLSCVAAHFAYNILVFFVIGK